MSAGDVAREFRELSLDSIVPPLLDARIARDPEQLEELARDIARRGLIFPLTVVRVLDKYEIVDGYRRYLACRQAGRVTAECLVYPTKEAALEGVKYAANAYREAMSPAEEAVFFHELYEHECEHDLDRVVAMMGKSRAYIDSRLALLSGDEAVFEAVRQQQIPLGAAHALNSITDPTYRHYYLTHAIQSGASVGVVEGWARDWKLQFSGPAAPPPAPSVAPAVQAGTVHDPHRCYVCQESDPRFIPETVPIHTHCKIAILDKLLRGAAAAGEPEPSSPDPRRI